MTKERLWGEALKPHPDSLFVVSGLGRTVLSLNKNARCGQVGAMFELDFHISCTGVLFRVTGLSKILLNWPVHDDCKSSKVGHRNPDRKHKQWVTESEF